MDFHFAQRVALPTRRSIFGAIQMLAFAGLVALITIAFVEALKGRAGQFAYGTSWYRNAQWASTSALVSLISSLCALFAWLVARSIRGVLALPSVSTPTWLTVLRVPIVLVCLIILAIRSIDEVNLRYSVTDGMQSTSLAPYSSLALGLLLIGFLGLSVPRWLRAAKQGLSTRALWLGAPFAKLDALPTSGRVHTRGSLRSLDPTVRALISIVDDRVVVHTQLAIEDGPRRAHLDVPQERFVWVPAKEGARDLVDNDIVDVLADVDPSSPTGGYRDGLARLVASSGPVFVLSGASAFRWKLLAASLIEAFVSLVFLASLAALVGGWGYLAYLTH